MGEKTTIGWCDHTFNPWWGCTKVSRGCKRCYADAFSHRLGLKIWGQEAPRRFFDDSHWKKPISWNRKAKDAEVRRRVFCGSMMDWAELLGGEVGQRQNQERARLFDMIEKLTDLDFLMLTKRPENVMEVVPKHWHSEFPENVWLGATMENQEMIDLRAVEVLKCPAVRRFASYEPAVGPGDFRKYLELPGGWEDARAASEIPRLDWIIVGGESGSLDAEGFNIENARSVIDQCWNNDAAPFVKQLGANPYVVKEDGTLAPVIVMRASKKGKWIRDLKAEDWDQWPEQFQDLKVREFPRMVA